VRTLYDSPTPPLRQLPQASSQRAAATARPRGCWVGTAGRQAALPPPPPPNNQQPPSPFSRITPNRRGKNFLHQKSVPQRLLCVRRAALHIFTRMRALLRVRTHAATLWPPFASLGCHCTALCRVDALNLFHSLHIPVCGLPGEHPSGACVCVCVCARARVTRIHTGCV
jgi:hypothetical protein